MNPQALYYNTCFLLSLLLAGVYLCMWNKRMNVLFTLVFSFIPIANLGNVLMAHARTYEAALMANRVIYTGMCFEVLFVLFSVFNLCRIQLGRVVRALLFAATMIVYLASLMVGVSDIFYRSADFVVSDGVGMLVNRQYGFMHTVFYVMLGGYALVALIAMAYVQRTRQDISRRVITLLFVPQIITLLAFFCGKYVGLSVELVPAAMVLTEILYLVIANRVNLYNVADTGIDSMERSGESGIVSFDRDLNYLGSNETARRIVPQLKNLTVDEPADESVEVREALLSRVERFRENEAHDTFLYTSDDRIYRVRIVHLSSGGRKRGYQLLFIDDTQDQRNIEFLDRYNEDLEREVAIKTEHIVSMHDNLILSMATMVESRDNSTGGHIRRTSEGVRLLTDEMARDPDMRLDEDFRKRVVKAAPMHDLGKIAVDDAVLRKPGRFTPEEFEKMKAHAAEGARIVHEILKSTDDEQFRVIAENVAHYHHERWDGSGYPEGLKGEAIPIEARIMAIADVYDALVSKRVYKDSMSFEQADAIIMEGMGKHFDRGLEKYYVAARAKLEAYYEGLE